MHGSYHNLRGRKTKCLCRNKFDSIGSPVLPPAVHRAAARRAGMGHDVPLLGHQSPANGQIHQRPEPATSTPDIGQRSLQAPRAARSAVTPASGGAAVRPGLARCAAPPPVLAGRVWGVGGFGDPRPAGSTFRAAGRWGRAVAGTEHLLHRVAMVSIPDGHWAVCIGAVRARLCIWSMPTGSMDEAEHKLLIERSVHALMVLESTQSRCNGTKELRSYSWWASVRFYLTSIS